MYVYSFRGPIALRIRYPKCQPIRLVRRHMSRQVCSEIRPYGARIAAQDSITSPRF